MASSIHEGKHVPGYNFAIWPQVGNGTSEERTTRKGRIRGPDSAGAPDPRGATLSNPLWTIGPTFDVVYQKSGQLGRSTLATQTSRWWSISFFFDDKINLAWHFQQKHQSSNGAWDATDCRIRVSYRNWTHIATNGWKIVKQQSHLWTDLSPGLQNFTKFFTI